MNVDDAVIGRGEYLTTSGFITSAAENMSAPDTRDYVIAPPTIAGLPITTFSYIFLAVGGTAPILFIVIVVISMKCYSWRKFRRYQRYAAQLQATKDIWHFERNIQNHGKTTHESVFLDVPNVHGESFPTSSRDFPAVDFHPTTLYSKHGKGRSEVDLTKVLQDYGLQVTGARLSSSNPNVYFKETPLLIINGIHDNNLNSEANKNIPHRSYSHLGNGFSRGALAFNKFSHGHSGKICEADWPGELKGQGQTRRTNGVVDKDGIIVYEVNKNSSEAPISCTSAHLQDGALCTDTNVHQRDLEGSNVSLSSEEARALACFDRIYDGLDSSPTNTNSAKNRQHAAGKGHGHDNRAFVQDEADSSVTIEPTLCPGNNEKGKIAKNKASSDDEKGKDEDDRASSNNQKGKMENSMASFSAQTGNVKDNGASSSDQKGVVEEDQSSHSELYQCKTHENCAAVEQLSLVQTCSYSLINGASRDKPVQIGAVSEVSNHHNTEECCKPGRLAQPITMVTPVTQVAEHDDGQERCSSSGNLHNDIIMDAVTKGHILTRGNHCQNNYRLLEIKENMNLKAEQSNRWIASPSMSVHQTVDKSAESGSTADQQCPRSWLYENYTQSKHS